MADLRQTALHSAHEAANARLVPFAGWEMPLQYAGIREEHLAVREGAGVFDVSHMGQIESLGPEAEAFLQRVLSNDIAALPKAGAQYSLLCREDGGVIDDLFTYRLGPERFLTVTNAANHEKDLAWFRREVARFDAEVADVADSWAMLAVQGPRARPALDRLAEEELPARFRTAELVVAGVNALVCGTGYTGEDGCELLVAPPDAPVLWDALREVGIAPAGLGARDTLRLESCFHLYGNDLDEEHSPLEAGLDWCCKPETGFIGAANLKPGSPQRRLVPFVFTDRGIPRRGNPIHGEGGEGVVTSGAFSPSLGIGIGMGYVALSDTQVGTRLDVDVRGTHRRAVVASKPIFKSAS